MSKLSEQDLENQQQQLTVLNRDNFDSDEEMYMYWFFKELQNHGFIRKIILHPKPWRLSSQIIVEYHKEMKTKSKFVPEEILKGHIYTTDFLIIWDESAINIFTTLLSSDLRKKKSSSLQYIICDYETLDESSNDLGELVSYVEVKPSFDQNNMTRLAKLNQKWVFDKFGDFVNIVIPEKHFDKSFTPTRYFFTNKSKVNRKINYKNVKTLQTFFKENDMIEGFKNSDDNILNQLF